MALFSVHKLGLPSLTLSTFSTHIHSPHSVDQLDPSKTVLQFFKDTYPNDIATGFKKDEDDWRAFVGELHIWRGNVN